MSRPRPNFGDARVGWVLVALFAACGGSLAAPSTPTGTGPCRGSDLRADAVLASCVVDGPGLASPPASALSARVLEARVPSGGKANATVTLTNATRAPLAFDLTDGCGAFEAFIETPDAKPVSYQNECALGGLCGGARRARVTLEPGGALRATVAVDASIRRLEPSGDSCKEVPGGPVPPGRYRLVVSLPFTDVDASGTAIEREAVGDVVVTP